MKPHMTLHMTLHTFTPSTFCQKVLIAAYFKDVEVEEIHYDLFSVKDEGLAEKLTPWGRIPVVDVGQESWCESSSIIAMMDSHFGSPFLIPDVKSVAAKTMQFDRIVDAYLLKQFGSLFHHCYGMHRPYSEAALRVICHDIRTTLTWLEEHIGQLAFACDNLPSLADCGLIAACHHCAELQILDRYPSLNHYYDRALQSKAATDAIVRIENALMTHPAYTAFRSLSQTAPSEVSFLDNPQLT